MSLVIIHLSDFHIKDDRDNNPVFEKVQGIARACCGAINNGDDIILAVTGDIADTGASSQYNLGIELFVQIIDHIKKQADVDIHIAMVPGNHDCNFSENQDVRDTLIGNVKPNERFVKEAIVESISQVQANYCDFKSLYGDNIINYNKIVNTLELNLKIGKTLVMMFNSSWKSELKEQPGSLCMPINLLPEFKASDYDFIISLIHHPLNWLHPDNCVDFQNYIRSRTDLLLVGHEHKRDNYTMRGDNWSLNIKKGEEIQDSANSQNSSFSIYIFDNILSTIRTIDFVWDQKDKMYDRVSDKNDLFTRNLSCNQSLLPNETFYSYINDLGVLIHHYEVEDIKLKDLYCWPDLVMYDLNNYGFNSTKFKKINIDIPEHLSKNDISLIIGESLSGKTSLVKMLYSVYMIDRCCLLIDGNSIKSHTYEGLQSTIEHIFVEQYSYKEIERFRQLSKEEKVIFIDNFEEITFNDEHKKKIIDYLLSKFGQVIVFAEIEMNLPFLLSSKSIREGYSLEAYRIQNMGNLKREELIEKWYRLGGNSINETQKIENARKIINSVLGKFSKIVPATPIHIINLLQTADSAVNTSVAGSQYGYLYEALINRNLSRIPDSDSGTINLYTAILAQIAFKMLTNKIKAFSVEELIETVNKYNSDYKMAIDAGGLLEKTQRIGILVVEPSNKCWFRYPYVFYYFAGKFIANHLDDPFVDKQVTYMSEHLYNEVYGNVMIFVCHFSNNYKVIEDVLLKAYTLFDKVKPFDFSNPNALLDEANEMIERFLIPQAVGREEDIDHQLKESLIIKDKNGFQDGTINNNNSDEIENDDIEFEVTDVITAIKTMDVLGQILRNYPGDINGENKINIISEIHNLGMRVIQVAMDVLGYFEEDIIKSMADDVREANQLKFEGEIIKAVKNMFAGLLSQLTLGMISIIASSIASEHLVVADKEALSGKGLISGELVILETKFNYLNKPSFEDAIKYYEGLVKKNKDFAATILKSIVANYLRYHQCGHATRDRVCNLMSLSKNKLLVASTKES